LRGGGLGRRKGVFECAKDRKCCESWGRAPFRNHVDCMMGAHVYIGEKGKKNKLLLLTRWLWLKKSATA